MPLNLEQKSVFLHFEINVLPGLAAVASYRSIPRIRIWSINIKFVLKPTMGITILTIVSLAFTLVLLTTQENKRRDPGLQHVLT